MTASSVLLTYVFPGIGCILSFVMFCSSLFAVKQVRRVKRLGELNPIPYTGIVAQTSGQVIYSAVIKNWFVFLANAPGLVIGLWLTLSTLPHASLKVQNIMTTVLMSLAMYYSSITLLTTQLDVSPDVKKNIWGGAGAGALLFFYTGPLTTLYKVIKGRDSSSLHPPLIILMMCNVILWFSYGLAIKNPFIWVPESIGASFPVTSIVLLLIFPRKTILRERQHVRTTSVSMPEDGNHVVTAELQGISAQLEDTLAPSQGNLSQSQGSTAQLQGRSAPPQHAGAV